MKTNEKIDKINYLKKRISDLKYFIHTIDVTNFKSTYLKIITKTEKVVSVELLAERSFVIGEHKQIIDVPFYIIPQITEIAKKDLEECEAELLTLIK